MADRSLTLLFLGKDAGASATAAELAAKLKTLQEVTDKNTKAARDQGDQLKKLEQSFKNADRGMNGLLLTALELGPALVPIGAVGAGALAGLVPAAGAALLAFLGLKDAWKAGTLQATALGGQIHIFQGEFEHLKSIAAGGVMPGFTQALKEIQPLFPEINRNVALFSTQLGQIASTAAPGIVRLFLQLQPLFQTMGNILVDGARKFEQWAQSGDGIKNFVAYVQTNLPALISTAGNLATTVIHLVQAFAPFGSTSLAAIKLFSQAVNAIPVGVLQALVPILAGVALGIKALKEAEAASKGLELLSGKLGAAGFGAQTASGAVGLFGKAVGFLGPIGLAAGVALGGLSIIMGKHSQAAIEAQRRTNDLTQALQDGTVHATLYGQLVSNGAIPAATKLGISQDLVYDSVTRASGSLEILKAKIGLASGRYNELAVASQSSALQQDPAAYQANAKAMVELRTELVNLSTGVQQAQAEYDKAKQNVAQYAKAQGDAALAADVLSGKSATNAAALHLTEDAYISGKLAADKHAASSQTAAAAMAIEGDAAGLLTQQLNILTDTQLGASDANLGFKLANLQLAASLKASKNDLSLNTQAGIQNNQAINQAIRLAEQDGEALAKNEQASKGATKARADGTAKTVADLRALRDNIVAAGGNADAIQAIINKLIAHNNLPVPAKHLKAVDEVTPAAGKARDSIALIPTQHNSSLAAFDQASSVAWRVAQAIESVPTSWTTSFYANNANVVMSQILGHNAGGTEDWRGGLTWVGERGPELLSLPAHTQVMNHQKSMAYANSASSGGITVNVAVGGSVVTEKDLISAVANGLDSMRKRRGRGSVLDV